MTEPIEPYGQEKACAVCGSPRSVEQIIRPQVGGSLCAGCLSRAAGDYLTRQQGKHTDIREAVLDLLRACDLPFFPGQQISADLQANRELWSAVWLSAGYLPGVLGALASGDWKHGLFVLFVCPAAGRENDLLKLSKGWKSCHQQRIFYPGFFAPGSSWWEFAFDATAWRTQ